MLLLQSLSKGIPTLEVQRVAFEINSLSWRYKQLLSKSTIYTGGINSCFLNQLPMVEVQTLAELYKATPTLEVQTIAF